MKKIEQKKNAAKADVKKETKTTDKKEEAKHEAPKVEAAKGPERPKLPADFCLEKADWEGNATCFDPSSNNCKVCKKDFPKTQEACSARADYLATIGKASKAKKTSTGERKTKVGGVASQCKIINDGLLAKLPKSEIIANVAAIHYAGDVTASSRRVERHIKSLKDGTYVNAPVLAAMSYLDKPVKAVAAKK
jgi:hypothetical protein